MLRSVVGRNMADKLIDDAVFDELMTDTGAEFVDELVTTFLEEAPGMIAELKQALSEQDVDGFRRAAHSIKSNANVFGLAGLGELARDMELGGLEASSVSTLETIFEETSKVLRSKLDG